MKILILITLSINICFAGLRMLPENERYGRKQVSAKNHTKSYSANDKIIESVIKQSKELKELIKTKTAIPTIWDNDFDIRAGTVFKGILLNSVVSTNLDSPLLIKVSPGQNLSEEIKFLCVGTTKYKRVHTTCHMMITEFEEIEVSTQVLNIDGSAGLTGEYYSGAEEYIAGMLASEFTKGILEISQEKISTPYGELSKSTDKNKLLQGLVNTSNVTTDILQKEMQTKEPKVFINAGKKVLIFFNRKV